MALGDINDKLVDGVTGTLTKSVFINAIGWLLLAFVIIGLFGWWAYWYTDKKKYSKKITAFEIVGSHYEPALNDTAKISKIGKGGFEVLYLKKLKTWKLAYGGKVGKSTYYFFIDPIGYWYNGLLGANVYSIDKEGGLIPVITTNPTMRAQYTALEKQIDALHGEKTSFWDKYGVWVLTGTYIVLIGIFCWLSFREIAQFLGEGSALAEQMTKLAEQMNRLAVNLNNQQGTGLVTP